MKKKKGRKKKKKERKKKKKVETKKPHPPRCTRIHDIESCRRNPFSVVSFLWLLRNLGFPFLPSLRFLFFPDFGRKEIRGYVLSFSSKREAEGELVPLETFVSEDREEIWLFFRLEEDRKFEDEEWEEGKRGWSSFVLTPLWNDRNWFDESRQSSPSQ